MSREESFPSAATLWEPECWAVGKLRTAPRSHQRAPQPQHRAGGSVCCCSSHGAFREKKLPGDSCIPTSSVSSALLAAPLQIYLNRNQSALDSEGFSFNLALKVEESDFAKH